MQVNSTIIANFRNFIQTTNTIENAQLVLKTYRNIKIGDYNLNQSRCIWMSLMLYKFKQELEVSEVLWEKSRQLIISMLRSDLDLKSIIIDYLHIFDVWQKDDLIDLVTEIGANYYNLIQIKNSIENTKNTETINHWLPHYENLIKKIRSYCKSMGILEKIDEYVVTFEHQKYNIVKEIMEKAYWDKIEEDIGAGNLDIVYNNLSELKSLLLDIIPKSTNTAYLDEYLDIGYIKHIASNGVLDREYLINLFIFVIGILKQWDAEAFIEKYNNELKEINTLDTSLNNIIRCILQKLMILTFDLKNRKVLWNIILKK
jgi:hypothetical protein